MSSLLLDKKVSNYLRFGYVPELPPSAWLEQFFHPSSCTSIPKIEEVACVFERVMDQVISEVAPGRTCVIPLSGGWDSRLLLAGALKRLDRGQVRTVTFGTPGQFDFDIGVGLSRKLGLQSVEVNLSTIELEWSHIVDSAQVAPWTYMLDAFFNDLSKFEAATRGDVLVTGFLGDPTTLANYSATCDIEKGRWLFLKSQMKTSFFESFSEESLAHVNIATGKSAHYPAVNMFDVLVRQPSCTGPIVTGVSDLQAAGPFLGECRASGAISAAPFASPSWVNYWADLPRKYKLERKFFLEFCGAQYPEIFNEPSKYSLGARKKCSLSYAVRLAYFGSQYLHDRVFKHKRKFKANLNYIDYSECFRKRDDYIGCLRKAAAAVNTVRREPIDIDCLLQVHQKGKVDMSTEFLLILGAGANVASFQRSGQW